MNFDFILFAGRPGSGKSTQAKLLAEHLTWERFGTGDRFREILAENGHIGALIQGAMNEGRLLPDWLVTFLFEEKLLNMDAGKGLVCEGYARSLPQAQTLDEVMVWLKRSYVVIDVDVSEEEALRRQLSRSAQEVRPDSSSEEKVRVRFSEYNTNTVPAIEFFKAKGHVINVNGEQLPQKIAEDILAVLNLK